WRVGRIPARDLLPIEPGNKAVVVLQAEGELGDVRRIRDLKWNWDERRAVHVPHNGPQVGGNARTNIHRNPRAADQQTADFIRRKRAVPDGDFVDLAQERIAYGVENTPAADVEVKTRGSVIGDRSRGRGGQVTVVEQLERLAGTDGD